MASADLESEAWRTVVRALRASADATVVALADAAPIWIGVNGVRVDARLRDHEGVEHHVVALRKERDAELVAVFHQPTTVPSGPGVVVVANGPAGAGKSTLLGALARLDDHPWVVLDEPVIGSVDPALLLWPDRAAHLHRGFLDAVAALARAGVRVGVAAGGRQASAFATALAGTTTITVGLHCAADVLAARERRRPDRWGGLAEQSAGIHDGWAYDLELDTSDEPVVEDLAREVLRLVDAAAEATGS